jgi:hypothetical protein
VVLTYSGKRDPNIFLDARIQVVKISVEGRGMASIELVVGKVDGFSVIPLTLAWASILKRSKGVDNLKRVCASHGVPWDKVIYAQIEVEDPDNGFSVHNLLDCAG